MSGPIPDPCPALSPAPKSPPGSARPHYTTTSLSPRSTTPRPGTALASEHSHLYRTRRPGPGRGRKSREGRSRLGGSRWPVQLYEYAISTDRTDVTIVWVFRRYGEGLRGRVCRAARRGITRTVPHDSLFCASNSIPTSKQPPRPIAFFPPRVATYSDSIQSTRRLFGPALGTVAEVIGSSRAISGSGRSAWLRLRAMSR